MTTDHERLQKIGCHIEQNQTIPSWVLEDLLPPLR